jgi:hypothetical protein
MKIFFVPFGMLLAVGSADAFRAPSYSQGIHHAASVAATTLLYMGYVPDGMSPEQWRKLQEQEKKAKGNKDYGAYGPSTFKSRSLRAFQQVRIAATAIVPTAFECLLTTACFGIRP